MHRDSQIPHPHARPSRTSSHRLGGAKDTSVLELSERGVVLVGVSIDVKGNRVVVGVERLVGGVEAAVHEIVPDAVVVEQEIPQADACDLDDCPPMKAGLEIENLNAICTSGWLARRSDNGNVGVITAGHCIDGSTDMGNWYHSDTKFGDENDAHGWHNNSYGDVGFIKLVGLVPGAYNKVLVKPSTGKVVRITSLMAWTDQIQGTLLCRIGWGSWWHHDHTSSDGGVSYPANPDYTARKCGEITVYDSDSLGVNDERHYSEHDGERMYIFNMKVWEFDSWPGDSGGVVFQQDPNDAGNLEPNATLLGTHVHSHTGNNINGDSWYSTWSQGRIELEARGIPVWPCKNDDCTNPF